MQLLCLLRIKADRRLQSPEFDEGFTTVTRKIVDRAALFDQHNIGRQLQATRDAAPVAVFDEITQRYNDVLDTNFNSFQLPGVLHCRRCT